MDFADDLSVGTGYGTPGSRELNCWERALYPAGPRNLRDELEFIYKDYIDDPPRRSKNIPRRSTNLLLTGRLETEAARDRVEQIAQSDERSTDELEVRQFTPVGSTESVRYCLVDELTMWGAYWKIEYTPFTTWVDTMVNVSDEPKRLWEIQPQEYDSYSERSFDSDDSIWDSEEDTDEDSEDDTKEDSEDDTNEDSEDDTKEDPEDDTKEDPEDDTKEDPEDDNGGEIHDAGEDELQTELENHRTEMLGYFFAIEMRRSSQGCSRQKSNSLLDKRAWIEHWSKGIDANDLCRFRR
ncbi:MAG: hypothetical protein M1817_000615 [Caeruleum heppii]|nr:MAG: hypothetical protein M1817_000615 [Caeruleum heppii]